MAAPPYNVIGPAEPPAAAPSLAARLGWRHTGFRADRRGARLATLLILGGPALFSLVLALRGELLAADYSIYYRAAQTFDKNPVGPIYESHHDYLYPPFFLTIFRPLVWLPPNIALALFMAVKWVGLFVSLRLAWRLCAPAGEDVPPIVALGSFLLTLRYFGNDMGNGNINVLMLAGVLVAAWLALRGKAVAAGAVAGLLASLKVTPALLLVYFVWKGWWKSLVGAALALGVALLAWPALVIGWDANLRLLGEWWQHVVAGYLAGGVVNSPATNQSLTGLLNRVFGPAVALYPDTYITLIDISTPVRTAVRAALAILIIGAIFWVSRPDRRRAADPPRAPALAGEIALIQIAMLLLSGYTWKAHYVAMILPYSVLLAYLADARFSSGPKRTVFRLLAASGLCMLLSSEMFGPYLADRFMAWGIVFFSGVTAGIGVLIVRHALRIEAERQA